MRYLVCVDGSECSHKAIETAANIAKAEDELVLLHISEPIIEPVTMMPGPIGTPIMIGHLNSKVLEKANNLKKEEGKRLIQKCADDVKSIHPDTLTNNIRGVWACGSPRECILPLAKKHEIDVIVVGSRGLGMVKRALLGSVSTFLVHESEVPVLVVK